MLVYIASRYTADTPEEINQNVIKATEAGKALLKRGYCVIVPHSMTQAWDQGTDLTWEDFMRNCLTMLERCDAICLLEGWEQSHGANMEKTFAQAHDMPIYYGVDELP